MRESEVAQLCPTLRDPMDCSLPGSSIHGIFQARVLEWGAIAFSVIFTIYMQITINNKHFAITDLFTVLSIILEHLFTIILGLFS